MLKNTVITESQRNIMRHALGLLRSTEEYRNYYFAPKTCDTYASCVELVQLGMMREKRYNRDDAGSHYFEVTEDGKKAARE